MDIRTAKKTDQGEISKIVYSSGPEFYDFIYETDEKTALEYINYEFKSGKGFVGHKNLTVAVENKRVIGTGSFYTGKSYRNLSIGSLVNIVAFYGLIKAFSVIKKASFVSKVMYEPKKNELYLSNFGVSEKFRGNGIGSQILSMKINMAKAKGLTSFNLDVAIDNPQAEKLYVKFGLKTIKTKSFKKNGVDTTNLPDYKHMQLKF